MKNNRFILCISLILFFMAPLLHAQQQMTDDERAEIQKLKTDWPNLARFHDENTNLRQPAAGENRVVFMGNSITEGWKESDPAFFTTKPYINRGISGQTTPQMLIRFRPDVIDLNPKVVVILAGINDIAGNTGPATLEMIEANIASMAELARFHGIKVVLSSVLPAYDFWWNPGVFPTERISALNEWIKKYAAESGFTYLDYYSHMADETKALKVEYTMDGVHPNLAGYKVMEPLAEMAIENALKKQ